MRSHQTNYPQSTLRLKPEMFSTVALSRKLGWFQRDFDTASHSTVDPLHDSAASRGGHGQEKIRPSSRISSVFGYLRGPQYHVSPKELDVVMVAMMQMIRDHFDADVTDTRAGKKVYHEWASRLDRATKTPELR